MCEVAREYNLDDFKKEVKKILDECNDNEGALTLIIEANKRLNQSFIDVQYKQDCEIELLKRLANKDKMRVNAAKFILDGYGKDDY